MGGETGQAPAVRENCDFEGGMTTRKAKLVKETRCPKCRNRRLRDALPGEVT